MTRILLSVAVLVLLSSCAAHRRPPAAPQNESAVARGYLDLQPGWRIRAVTPVTLSGTFNVAAESAETSGNILVIKAPKDFVGYEVSYYSVDARPGGGISIRFASAEVTKAGKATRASHPLVQLFTLPPDMRFARLLFLTRVSPADHDQGVVAAPTAESLEAITEKVLADPERNCASNTAAFCAWIPVGIAVQPEKRRPDRKHDWVPAT